MVVERRMKQFLTLASGLALTAVVLRNRLGGPIPHSAPCTYLSNYGWGFTYWSRPMVAPLGQRQTPLDQNTAIAAGTLFATEEALLVFEPGSPGEPAQERLKEVTAAQARFVRPLRLVYKGTGPW